MLALDWDAEEVWAATPRMLVGPFLGAGPRRGVGRGLFSRSDDAPTRGARAPAATTAAAARPAVHCDVCALPPPPPPTSTSPRHPYRFINTGCAEVTDLERARAAAEAEARAAEAAEAEDAAARGAWRARSRAQRSRRAARWMAAPSPVRSPGVVVVAAEASPSRPTTEERARQAGEARPPSPAPHHHPLLAPVVEEEGGAPAGEEEGGAPAGTGAHPRRGGGGFLAWLTRVLKQDRLRGRGARRGPRDQAPLEPAVGRVRPFDAPVMGEEGGRVGAPSEIEAADSSPAPPPLALQQRQPPPAPAQPAWPGPSHPAILEGYEEVMVISIGGGNGLAAPPPQQQQQAAPPAPAASEQAPTPATPGVEEGGGGAGAGRGRTVRRVPTPLSSGEAGRVDEEGAAPPASPTTTAARRAPSPLPRRRRRHVPSPRRRPSSTYEEGVPLAATLESEAASPEEKERRSLSPPARARGVVPRGGGSGGGGSGGCGSGSSAHPRPHRPPSTVSTFTPRVRLFRGMALSRAASGPDPFVTTLPEKGTVGKGAVGRGGGEGQG